MLSVAWAFALKGLAPPCPVLKGIFVPAAFRGMGRSLEGLHAECQVNLRPCRVLECSPACPTLSSVLSTVQRDGCSQAELA